MQLILGFRAPWKANLPRTLGRLCPDHVPTFRPVFLFIDSSSLLDFSPLVEEIQILALIGPDLEANPRWLKVP